MMKFYSGLAHQRKMFGESDTKASYLVIAADGTTETYPIENADSVSFEQFKEKMGLVEDDTLEFIDADVFSRVSDIDILCIVDEEGRLKAGSQPNDIASLLCEQAIFGPAVFINREIYDDLTERDEDGCEEELEDESEEDEKIERDDDATEGDLT